MPKQKPLQKKLAHAQQASTARPVSRFDTARRQSTSSSSTTSSKRPQSVKLPAPTATTTPAVATPSKFERRIHAAQRRGQAQQRRSDALKGAVEHAATRNVFVRGGGGSGSGKAKKDLFSLADDEAVQFAGTLSIRAPGEQLASLDRDGHHHNDDDLNGNDTAAAGGAAATQRRGKLAKSIERGRLLKAAKRDARDATDTQLAALNARFERLVGAVALPSSAKRSAVGDAGGDDYADALASLRDAPRGRPVLPVAAAAAAGQKRASAPSVVAVPAKKKRADEPPLADDEADNSAVDSDDDDQSGDDDEAVALRRKAALAERAALAVPASVDDFEALVRDLTPARVIGEIMRILECTDSVQLEHFTTVLLDFYSRAAAQRPAPLPLLNALVAPLNVLANAHADVATRACRELVRSMTPGAGLHALELAQRKAAKAGAPLAADKVAALRAHALKQLAQRRARLPTLPQLLVMRAQLELWPVNEHRHAILTPMALRLAQAMMHGRVSTPGELYRAFLCVALFKPMLLGERRYAAEPVHLLTALLTTLLEYDDPNDADIARTGVQRGAAPVAPALLRIGDDEARRTLAPRPLTLPAIVRALDERADDAADEQTPLTPQAQVDCIRHALVELAFFVELYADLVALPEVLLRTSRLFEALPDAPLLPESCVELAAAVAQALQRATMRVLQTRVPLALQARLAEPRASAVVSKDILVRDERDVDPRERTRKLRLRVRREEKGAMRELRRDAFFMADERHKRWLAERAEIDKREREIIGMLARQQGEINILEHIKKAKQPKAGVGKDFNAASK